MKKLSIFALIVCMLLATASTVLAAPWVYPASEASPSTTEYWYTPISSGPNSIDLIVWNHANKETIGPDVTFVIAIKSGTASDFTITGINVTQTNQDLSGTTTPDHFSPGGIFPCPWIEYKAATTLSAWESADGWQGDGDTSGVAIHIELNIVNPANVHLYFLAWAQIEDEPGYVNTPYSHITETFTPPDHEIPEVPLGPVMAMTSMVVAFGAYFAIRKRRL